MRRLLLTAAAIASMAIPASVIVGTATPSFATSSVTCTGLKGTISGTVTIKTCSPSGGKAYKSASGAAASLATHGTITWKGGGTTTISGGSAVVASPNKCAAVKAGDLEYSFSATVSAATTVGVGIPKVGDTVSANACVSTKGKISLAPGSVMHL